MQSSFASGTPLRVQSLSVVKGVPTASPGMPSSALPSRMTLNTSTSTSFDSQPFENTSTMPCSVAICGVPGGSG